MTATAKPLFRRVGGAFRAKPPSTMSLWRIMKVEKLSLMLEGGLWFARLDQFNDPREGSLPNGNLVGLLGKLPTASVGWIQRQYVLGVERSFALCWHMNDGDPDASLWTSFADVDDGVAVRTTWPILIEQLRAITGTDGPLHFGAVDYVDHAVDAIPDGNVLEAAFVVADSFQGEREARALIHTHGTDAYDILVDKIGPCGHLVAQIMSAKSNCHELVGGHQDGKAIVVRVNARALICEIRMASGTRPVLQWRVLRAAARNGVYWRVRPRTAAQIGRFALLVPIAALGLGRLL